MGDYVWAVGLFNDDVNISVHVASIVEWLMKEKNGNDLGRIVCGLIHIKYLSGVTEETYEYFCEGTLYFPPQKRTRHPWTPLSC
jgi:hypothetical protein